MLGKSAIKILLLCFISFTGLILNAQTITKIEYSIDAFVKQGDGTQIEVSDDASEIDNLFDIDITALEPGNHVLYIRTLNSDGIWSLPTEKSFFVPETDFAETIVDVEYSIDMYEKPGDGTILSVNSDKSTIDKVFNIDIDGLSPGNHTIYIRTKNEFGIWSLPVQKSFLISEPDIAKVEKVHYRIYNESYEGDWQMTTLSPQSKNIETTIDVSTAELNVEQSYFFEFFAVNSDGVRGFSAFLEEVALVPTGIKQTSFADTDFKVYPNPTQGYLHIEHVSDKNVSYQLKICNLQGQILNNRTYNNSLECIDLSPYAKGIYILVFQTDNYVTSTQIVVE